MKKIGFKIFYIFAAVFVLLNLVLTVYDSLVFSIDDVPEGKFVAEVPSQNGQRIMRVYHFQNDFGQGIRVSLTEDGKSHNIYWQAGISEVDCHWLNAKMVQINEVKLNVESDWTYDCRSGRSIFTEGSIEDMTAAEEQYE